jgi:hypothetical protein
MTENVEIELQYYDRKDQGSWIVDCVIISDKVKPAWEFRTIFAKTKITNVEDFRCLDLYYKARIPVGAYVGRYIKEGSLDNVKLQIFIATETGLTEAPEIPETVRDLFMKNIPY